MTNKRKVDGEEAAAAEAHTSEEVNEEGGIQRRNAEGGEVASPSKRARTDSQAAFAVEEGGALEPIQQLLSEPVPTIDVEVDDEETDAPEPTLTEDETTTEDEIVKLIHKREQARAKKDWGQADQIREELRGKGIELYDKNHEWQARDGRKGVIPIGAAGPGSLTAAAACSLSDVEIIGKINEREEARRRKDFATSDLKREQLRAAGVDVFDKERCWKTNDGRQGMIGVSVQAHVASATHAMSEADIDSRLQQREQARAQKDWPTADKIREELRARGIEIFDQTSMWKSSDGRVGMLPPQPGRAGGQAALTSAMIPALTAAGIANPALALVAGAGAGAGAGSGALSESAIFALIQEREQARKSKNWPVADKIRDGLRARGVELYDKTGQWRASDGREGTIVGAGKGGVTAVNPGGTLIGSAGPGPGSGSGSGSGTISEAEILAYLNQREIHRANKNWAQADVIRTTLRQAGVEVYDKEARWTTRDGRSGTIAGAGQGGASGGAGLSVGVPTPMQVAAHMQMQQQMAALQQQGIGGGAQAAMKVHQQMVAQTWQQQQVQQMHQYQQQQMWHAQQQQMQHMQQWGRR